MKIKEIVEARYYSDDARDAMNDAADEEYRTSAAEYLTSGGDYKTLEDVAIDAGFDDATWDRVVDPILSGSVEERYVRNEDIADFVAMFPSNPETALKEFSVSISEYVQNDEARAEWEEAEWERRNPYASRGLSKSDFY